ALRDLPPDLRASAAAWIALALSLAAGVALGAATGESAAHRIVRALFFAAAFSYFAISVIDFREHFLLERALTGRALSFAAIPVGETINHTLTVITVVSILVLLRQPPASL